MQYYWDALEQKDRVNAKLTALPTFATCQLDLMARVKNPKGLTAVIRNGDDAVVAVMSKHYKLVQHREAFQPVIDGLNLTGEDYSMAMWHNDTHASMSILTTETEDGVKIGFQVLNSVNGTTSIRYGFRSFRTTRWIEVVGYRQVCSNGAVMRVPLDKAEFVRNEEREKIETLLTKHVRIIHIGKVEEKVKAIQYVVEAMSLLKEPVARMIQAAENKEVGVLQAEELLKKYLGKRLFKNVNERFKQEPASLWGLYNSITWVASHDKISLSSRNSLLDKAATLLMEEI